MPVQEVKLLLQSVQWVLQVTLNLLVRHFLEVLLEGETFGAIRICRLWLVRGLYMRRVNRHGVIL